MSVSKEYLKKIRIRACEAVAWSNCTLKNSDGSLRSELLEPKISMAINFYDDKVIEDAITDICDNRSILLEKEGIFVSKISEGRPICFYPDYSLSEGFIFLSSEGYFDEDEFPPWDTWIDYSVNDFEHYHPDNHACLISWVPPQYIELVDRSISEDPYGCLVWAEKLQAALSMLPHQEN